ncbi:MAG: RsmE family RNA methyltransferase [Desulfuromonadales bacterium]|nr:RsmE family RNA methyltransferase [Desulfuromonadales bacterium]
MHRLFVPPAALQEPSVVISDEGFHHLSVLRLRVGDELLLLDGCGHLARAILRQLGRSTAQAEVLERWKERESLLPLRLMQGLPKGETFEWLLEKGVELGVSAFTPVITARSQLRGEKTARWQKIIQEAARQSRRPLLPALEELQPLAAALTATTESLRLMLWEEGSTPLNSVLPPEAPPSCVLLVGPEGGFSAPEADAAMLAGFISVSLGKRILRTETAGMAVAAVLQNRYGDFGTTSSGKDQERC